MALGCAGILRELNPGEVVQVAVSAFREGLGNGGVLALTDRRLIFHSSRVIGESENLMISRDSIESARIDDTPIYANLCLIVLGEDITFSVIRPRKRAWELFGYLLAEMDSTGRFQPDAQSNRLPSAGDTTPTDG